MTPEQLDLQALKHSLADTQPVGVLVECAKTLDQVYVWIQSMCGCVGTCVYVWDYMCVWVWVCGWVGEVYRCCGGGLVKLLIDMWEEGGQGSII